MAEEKKIYAVLIGDRYASDTPFNEAVFFADDAEDARRKGNEYIRAWDLKNQKVRKVRLMSKEEWEDRKNNQKEYEAGGYLKYREKKE